MMQKIIVRLLFIKNKVSKQIINIKVFNVRCLTFFIKLVLVCIFLNNFFTKIKH